MPVLPLRFGTEASFGASLMRCTDSTLTQMYRGRWRENGPPAASCYRVNRKPCCVEQSAISH